MTAAWFCRRWVSKSRRCGARMTLLADGDYRCPRCQPTHVQLHTGDP